MFRMNFFFLQTLVYLLLVNYTQIQAARCNANLHFYLSHQLINEQGNLSCPVGFLTLSLAHHKVFAILQTLGMLSLSLDAVNHIFTCDAHGNGVREQGFSVNLNHLKRVWPYLNSFISYENKA